jgi:hypothetical protein
MRRESAVLRTAVSVTAAALAATFALAACGPVRMGAAAIVGDGRISTATVSDQVKSLNSTNASSGGKVSPQFPQSQAAQQVLGWLLRFKVREQLAEREHITVTTGESQRALAAISAQAKQGGLGSVPLRVLAAANGLPPGLLPELGRYQAIETDALRKLVGGPLPTSSTALNALGQRFLREQCLAAKSLNIRVNPEFGRVDYQQLSIVPAPATLSAPQSPSPSPTGSPQLAPAC